jgi:hypothetical protein
MGASAKRPGKTLNAANLKALGAERLAALLLDVAGDYPAAKRRLRLELAGAASAEDLNAEIDKRLDAIAESQARVSWRRYREFARDLDIHRQAMAGPLAEQAPDLALLALIRFVGLQTRLVGRVNDAKGEVGAALDAAVEDAARIAPQAKLADRRALTDRLLDVILAGGSRAVGLLGALAPALDKEAVAALRHQVEQAANLRRRGGLTGAAQLLADLAGDVDAYIAYFTPSQLVLPPIGAEVARRLIQAGRLAEARQALARSVPKVAGQPLSLTPVDGGEWDEVNIALLEAEGDPEAAQAARWARFEATLAPGRLREFLKRLDDFDDIEAEEKAVALARRHPNVHAALGFLIDWPALPAAAELVVARDNELRPEYAPLFARAATLLAERYPLAATILLRLMIWDTVRHAQADQYKLAERQLAEAAALAPRLGEEIESHEAFAEKVARFHRW